MIELKDTVEMMNSKDYKERFIAEYWQLKIRYEKLKAFNNQIKAAWLTRAVSPKHDCPDELLEQQQAQMGMLLSTLEIRAIIENINLDSINAPKQYDCANNRKE